VEKRAYFVQMSFDISPGEVAKAERAQVAFENVMGNLRVGRNHLALIYEPFDQLQESDSAQLHKYRRVFRRYRGQVQENYEAVMASAKRAVLAMAPFSSDIDIADMMNAFGSLVEDLENHVNRFLGLFRDLHSEQFLPKLKEDVNIIRKDTEQLIEIIQERLLDYIDSNILAKTWVKDVADDHAEGGSNQLPLIVELFKERQNTET
jgi:hypothetical protein